MARLGEYAPHVRHEMRTCPKHGLTEHGAYITGDSQQPYFKCLKCECERSMDYQRRRRMIQNGVTPPKTMPASKCTGGPVCTVCWLEHPEGECDR